MITSTTYKNAWLYKKIMKKVNKEIKSSNINPDLSNALLQNPSWAILASYGGEKKKISCLIVCLLLASEMLTGPKKS